MARPLTVFISDLHLTDQLGGPKIPWELTFERFWTRIAAAQGDQPAHLVIIGDLFDIVRSPTWFETPFRPYHEPDAFVQKVTEQIIDATVEREAAFFGAIREQVEAGRLRISYVLGNHDRLIGASPRARRAIWKAFTGEDREIDFPTEMVISEHDVLCHHGHTTDPICSTKDGSAPISDAFGIELIVRFPEKLREKTDLDDPHLDDIDDVRPLYAVPAWIRTLGGYQKGLMRPAMAAWSELVEEFLENEFLKDWVKGQSKIGRINPGNQLQMLLRLSTGKVMLKGADKRLTSIFGYLQQAFDGKFQERAAKRLETDARGLNYVLNGHSHFAAMTPLGHIDGRPSVYFNTGTWRTVHQIGTKTSGRPTFLPYDSMSYVVFFPDDDPLERRFEWWQGAMVGR